MKRKKTKDFVDDGRVIANMNIDGMPQSMVRSRVFGEFGRKKEDRESVELSRREFWDLFFGALSSYLLFAGIAFGGFALFILFCIKIWFK